MSEHLFRFALPELTTLRLICQGCQVAVEFALDDLAGRTGNRAVVACPFCRHDFNPQPLTTGNGPLVDFARAAVALRQLGAAHVKAEFALPVKE